MKRSARCGTRRVNKTGGPFGAVIAGDGLLVAAAGNSVVDLGPGAHAEVTPSDRLQKLRTGPR